VKERPPFALAATFDPPEAVPGLPASVIIRVTRDPDFMEDIALQPLAGLPKGVAVPKLPPIPKGQKEGKVALTLPVKAPLGTVPLTVSGQTKSKGKVYAAVSDPALLVVGAPFALKVEPVPLTLTPGAKAELKIVAVRKAGYQGPIALVVRNLPPNVTAGKAVI